jgi:hypothetical protein
MGLAVGYFDLCLNSQRIDGVIIISSRQSPNPLHPRFGFKVSGSYVETCQTEACFYPNNRNVFARKLTRYIIQSFNGTIILRLASSDGDCNGGTSNGNNQ